MKLVFIITDYGSYNNFLAELSSTIAGDDKFTLHIICSPNKVINIKDKELTGKENINFHFINIPRTITLSGQLKAAGKIRSLIKKINPDLIHSHFTTATFPTILFRKHKYTYWSTIHGLGMNSSKGITKFFFTIVELTCFVRLNRIFVVNNQDYNLLNKNFGKKLTKYKCLGFGCDINKFNPTNFSDEQKCELRNALDIKPGVIVIAFTGRYVYFKGFNLVIKSFKILIDQYPDKFKLVLMGGPDPIHKTGLDEEGEKFFKTSRDIINVGFTSDVDQYLSITDIFLFPSKKEGLPTCILESLAMGVPVVTFNARGNNDIVKNNYNGILIEPDENVNKEINDITNALKQLTFDINERNEFKKNALKDTPEYSREKFIKEHLNYYEELMKKEPVS